MTVCNGFLSQNTNGCAMAGLSTEERKRYRRAAKWSLTPEIERTIEEAIFGSGTNSPGFAITSHALPSRNVKFFRVESSNTLVPGILREGARLWKSKRYWHSYATTRANSQEPLWRQLLSGKTRSCPHYWRSFSGVSTTYRRRRKMRNGWTTPSRCFCWRSSEKRERIR